MPRIPTSKQLDLYEKLRKDILKIRRHLVRRKRKIEESGQGRMEALPPLVIPKRPPTRQRLMNMADPWRQYRNWLSSMKQSVSILKEHRRNYFIVFRDMLSQEGIDVVFKNGRITAEEMEKHADNPELQRIMRVYNKMFNRAYGSNGLEKFSDMYERGYIVQLRWIYDELEGKTVAGTFTEEQEELLALYSQYAKTNRASDSTSSTSYKRDRIGKGGKHKKGGK